MKKQTALYLAEAAIIAALYVVLTYLSGLFGLANGAVQIRLSEALTILPFLTPAAVPGLFAGCLIADMLTGCLPIDTIAGSLATLAAALLTCLIRKLADRAADTAKFSARKLRFLAPLPPILLNTLTLPFVFRYAYGIEGSIPIFMLTVGLGELISCGVLGLLLLSVLKKNAGILFH